MSPRTNVGTVEDLHASAVKACGLDDFGGDDDNYAYQATVDSANVIDAAAGTDARS